MAFKRFSLYTLTNIISNFFKGNARTVSVKKNAIGSLLIKGISIIISLMFVPMTLGYVKDDLYGIWLTISSIIVWINFFDIGFTLGLKNRLAEAIAVKDYVRGKALVSTTYMMLILLFVPLGIIGELLIPHINWSEFLKVSQEYNPAIKQAMEALLLFFCLQMIFNTLGAVVSAYQKVALASAFPVIGNAVSLVVIYILTKLVPPSLLYLAFAISSMPVLVIGISSLILYNGKFKAVRPSFKSINFSLVKSLFNLGAKFFIIQIQIVVLYQVTNILISRVAGPTEVASYNIAYKYLSVAIMVLNIILTPLWPAFTDAYVKKDFRWMNNIYRKLIKIVFLSAIAVVIMVGISPYIYYIWIGDRAEISFVMTISVAFYVIIHSWDSLQVMLINGIGAVKLQSYVVLIGLIFNIPLALFLGKYMGAIGVVSSMTIINIIYSVIFTIQINKLLKQKAKGIWVK